MKRFLLVIIVVFACVVLSTGVWAGNVTSGITGVSAKHTVVGTQHWYDFTVYNFSNQSAPSWDALVAEFVVDGVGLEDGVTPVCWTAPSGWDIAGKGWKKTTNEIVYNNGTGSPYMAPQSVAPGASFGGFRLCFDRDLGDTTRVFSFQTHVYAVKPVSDPAVPQSYVATKVDTPGGAYTWWDRSTLVPTLHDAPEVPEAPGLILLLIGITGYAGQVIRIRKRL